MSESVKTAVFVCLACAVGLVAFATRPVPPKKHKGELTPVKLFPDLTNPLDVARLEIAQFDEASHQCKKPFEVAQVLGRDGKSRWAIPSHFDYPADAKDHLGEAASLLMDIKSVNTAPGMDEEQGDLTQDNIHRLQNLYGVVDPNPDTVKASDAGVGTRITLKNKEGKVLASLIVGKQVGDQSNQHYVRYPDKDTVYVVNIDLGKVSTKFEDWIERNLLGMNTMDLKQVDIQDYAIIPMEDGLGEKLEGEYLLDYDFNATPAWKLSKDLRFDAAKKALVPQKLGADEELDTKKLDDLKAAIDDLKIVDVERKPAAVPPDLRVRSQADRLALGSLQKRGFFLAPDPDGVQGHYCVMSTKGDVAFQLSDGARYVLRFGESTGESSAADKAKDKKDPKTDKKDEPVAGSNRYLFVMAEFNKDAIVKPVYEELPKEQKPDDKKPDDKKADDKKADAKKPDEKKADVKAPDAKKAEEKKPDAKKKPDALMADDKPADAKDDKDAKPAVDAVQKGAARKEEPKKEEKKVDLKADDKPADVKDAKPAVDTERKDAPKKEEPKKEEKKVDLKAERERIEKENKRKLDEYNDKVAAGKKHKDQLNARFADWYYVISDDVYRKIHLTRADLVKKKEAKDKAKDADGHDHEHDHEHDHDHDSLPASPASTLEQLKKDAPAEKK